MGRTFSVRSYPNEEDAMKKVTLVVEETPIIDAPDIEGQEYTRRGSRVAITLMGREET